LFSHHVLNQFKGWKLAINGTFQKTVLLMAKVNLPVQHLNPVAGYDSPEQIF
jgi:hypothetical protein